MILNADSTPNVKLAASLRHVGYDNYEAICDLCDNSVEANAERVQVIRKNNEEISIVDDGDGMSIDILNEAIRFGSNIEKNRAVDLGRFGMGLCTASISIAKRYTVITKTVDGKHLKAIFDIDEVEKNNSWDCFVGDANKEDIFLFESFGLKDHGTIVILTKCDKIIERKNLPRWSKQLSDHLGETFCKFIQTGRVFFVDGQKVPAIDPLEWDDEATHKYNGTNGQDITYKIGEDELGKDINETINIKLSIVAKPKHGNQIINQGFYVYRNHRLITRAADLGLYQKEHAYGNMRGSISFCGNLDDEINLTFQKNKLTLNQGLYDKLKHVIGPQITGIFQKLRAETAAKAQPEIDKITKEVSEIIKKKSTLLMKPKTTKQKRNSPSDPSGTVVKKNTDITHPPKDKKQSALADRCRFEFANMTGLAPIYDCRLEGPTVVITLNKDHVFYHEMISEKKASVKTAYLFFIYALASAELREIDMEDDSMLELSWRLRHAMSVNFSVLLKN
jgi:hypothetical protein